VQQHYNNNQPSDCAERPSRSLDTKWGTIKHDVVKFIAVYKHVYATRESGTSLDEILQNALELYKSKDPKQHCFVYLYCWPFLKECPCWMETPMEYVQREATERNRRP
jgi:hypothetical protein